MKYRTYTVTLDRHEENFSGLRVTSSKTIGETFPLVPKADNVKALVGLLTDLPIDTRWMSIAEQVRDGLECGFFSIDLKSDEDFVTYSLGFMEV